jgi:hypothetical protein
MGLEPGGLAHLGSRALSIGQFGDSIGLRGKPLTSCSRHSPLRIDLAHVDAKCEDFLGQLRLGHIGLSFCSIDLGST